MKKIYSFLLLGLLLSIGNVWAFTKTEGFETKATSTSYNGTVTIATTESDCGIAWSIYYGTVSTNDKISGTRSAHMRWYASATENYPYIMSTTAVDGLSNIALKARTSNTNVKMDIWYSEDGEAWTFGKTHTFSAANTAEDESLDVPAGNKYVKFGVSSTSTAPTSGNYKLIVDDVVLTYSSSLVPATWSIDPASASVEKGSNTTLLLTTNYDGTLNFTSNDETVASVSYNASTKVITVTGVGAGTTTISATGAATATYEAISKTIDVTVTFPEFPSDVTDVMGPLGYSYFGLTADKGTSPNEYAQPEEESREKIDAYGVSLLFAKGESMNYPRYDASYMRFYNGNTLTITAPTGYTISKIVFTEPESGKAWTGSMSADEGVYVSSIKTWFATTTNVTSVVFTNDATKRVGGIEVYLRLSSITLGTNGWSTFAAAYKYTVSGADVYKAAADDEYNASKIILTKVENAVVPCEGGEEGIILKGEEGEIVTITPSNEPASDFSGNDLVGTITEQEPGDYSQDVYVLSTFNGVTAFNPCGNITIPAHKAFLFIYGVADPATAPIRIEFAEDNATNIEDLKANENVQKFFENGQVRILREGVVYDATGRVVK